MQKWLSVALFGSAVWMFAACGSDNSGGSVSDPVEACKQSFSTVCEKIFNCFTKDELDAKKAAIGLNAADCAIKFGAQCTPDMTNCASGETFHADKAQACVDGYKTLNCTDIKTDPIPTPAACDLVCTK